MYSQKDVITIGGYMFSKFFKPVTEFVEMVAASTLFESHLYYLAARLPESLRKEVLSKKQKLA